MGLGTVSVSNWRALALGWRASASASTSGDSGMWVRI